MLVAFRVDSSLKMGTGHLYRCLTLANSLVDNGHDVVFFCRQLEGNLISMLREQYPVVSLPAPSGAIRADRSLHNAHAAWLEVPYQQEIEQSQQAMSGYLAKLGKTHFDWLIADHYALDVSWQKVMRSVTNAILQIDDLADRQHDCDLLLDQNYYHDLSVRYQGKIPEHARALLGPEYALLRPEFAQKRSVLPSYQERMAEQRVVVFFGGIDAKNETEKAILGITARPNDGDIFDVIVGINNPHIERLTSLCAQFSNVNLHVQVPNIMDYFAQAYLYIGAVGATTWERCVLALPGVVCSVADNQVQLAKDLALIDGHHYLGPSETLTAASYQHAYQSFKANDTDLIKQAEKCAQLIDGLGCQRVVEQLVEFNNHE